jgi:argininosuccinate lyase
MSAGTFAPVYVDRVLDPGYKNWIRLFETHASKVHRAHLCMLAEQGVVSGEVASTLKAGIEETDRKFTEAGFLPEKIPQGMEDLYFLYETELGRRVGEENAAWLHTARSRNDMDGTVFRLALVDRMERFLVRAESLCCGLLERCKAGEGELTVLFTHGQPANPSTTAHYLSAILLDLLEDCVGLAKALETADKSTMGACAITGTGFPIDRERVAMLLGMGDLVSNTYQAISSSHWLTAPAQALKALMLDLGRFAADLLHKASCEVGLYGFPDDLVQISSIMPQKRNPVIIEHLRIRSGQAMGLCCGIEDLLRNVPYQDVNESSDAPITQFLEAFDYAEAALDLAAATFAGMAADQVRAKDIALRFGVTTTELADTIVREFGIGFRAAHGISAAFAKSAGSKAALRRAFKEKCDLELPWADEKIDAVLDPWHFVQVRTTLGGPSGIGMDAVYAEAQKHLNALKESLDSRTVRLLKAETALAAAWARLA